MRTWHFVASAILVVSVSVLCWVLLNSRTPVAEKSNRTTAKSADSKNPEVRPQRVGGSPAPQHDPAIVADGRDEEPNDDEVMPKEVRRPVKEPIELTLQNGRVNYQGVIEEKPEARYKGKKSFRILSVKLEHGRTYRIDHISKDLQAFLYLEDPDGNLLQEHSSANIGSNSRILYQAEQTGTYRIIATSLGGFRTGAFTFSVRVVYPEMIAKLPKGVPTWFVDLDTDGDAQVGLYEWRAEGMNLDEFKEYDWNGDGFITPEEYLRHMDRPVELKFHNDLVEYHGVVEELPETRYKGKKSFKVLTIKLEAGRTYQIDEISGEFQAFLHLEDADGKVLKENSSPFIGGNSRIVYQAEKTAKYRIVATSLAGYRTGAFTCTVRVINLPPAPPPWFTELDKDRDRQVSLFEWRRSGKRLDEFRVYDLNGDGLITLEEILRHMKRPVELKLQNGRVEYRGAIYEFAEERYRGKKSFKIFTVALLPGKTYQIDHTSPELQAFLHLEDPDGRVVKENGCAGIGGNARLFYQVSRPGIYRVIATSLSGNRPGTCTCSIRSVHPAFASLTESLATWYSNLDKDGDRQIGLNEWRKSGKPLNEFREYDLNGDGLITLDEVVRYSKRPTELRVQNGRAEYRGAIEEHSEDRYRGKKSFRIFTVKLESGRTYQIDHTSKELQSFLHLEDADGKLLKEGGSELIGGNARIVYQANRSGIYRIIATSFSGNRPSACWCAVRVVDPAFALLPPALAAWFSELDKDADRQIGLNEWRKSGKPLNEFREYDLNGDGLITLDEVVRYSKRPIELKFQNGVANCQNVIEELVDERYKGKKSFKNIYVKLERGKTYQIDLHSREMQAFLHLEDADGLVLAENSSAFIGGNSRIVYEASKTGVYRIIATSLAGFRTGAFTCSIRVLDAGGGLPKWLPPWFKELDTDRDGQVGLYEWRKSGRPLEEFREYDLNGDGLITVEELTRYAKKVLGLTP